MRVSTSVFLFHCIVYIGRLQKVHTVLVLSRRPLQCTLAGFQISGAKHTSAQRSDCSFIDPSVDDTKALIVMAANANNEESDHICEKMAGPLAGEQRDIIQNIFEDNPVTGAEPGDVW